MNDNEFYITARCPECGKVFPIKYKYRHQSICKGCLDIHAALIHLRPLLKGPIDIEAKAVLKDDYVMWKDYTTRVEGKE